MSNDERALLAAVCADPDSDLPRLVYADWLDDHGRPERAEFIRVQVSRAAINHTDDRAAKAALGRRMTALLSEHADGWRKELPNAVGRLRWGNFRRGFPDTIDLNAVSPDPPGLYDALDEGLRLMPVRSLKVVVRDMPAVGRLLDWPGLSAVMVLELEANDYYWQAARWGPELAVLLTARAWRPMPTVVRLRNWYFDEVMPWVWERLNDQPGPDFEVRNCWWRTPGEPPAFAASGGRVRW